MDKNIILKAFYGWRKLVFVEKKIPLRREAKKYLLRKKTIVCLTWTKKLFWKHFMAEESLFS